MFIKSSTALVIVALPLLAACGGGGGATYDGPVTQPPNDVTENSGPASMSLVDLVAFADEGTTTAKSFRGNETETWSQTRNCAGGECVTVDRLPGAETLGLVSYTNGTEAFLYSLMGEPVTDVALPSGIYNGDLTAQYRRGVDGDWIATFGEMNLLLDMQTGEVAIGGILDYQTASGSSSIQFFGDASVVNGAFVDGQTRIIVDSGGAEQLVTEGATTGLLADGADASAIFGLVSSHDVLNDFHLEGGFVAIHDPRF